MVIEKKQFTPLGNTGATKRLTDNCPDFGINEYNEMQERNWLPASVGATSPIEGRVIRLDGLTATIPSNNLERCKSFLQELFECDEPFFEASWGSRWYEVRYDWLHGITLHAVHRVECYRNHFKLDFLGRASQYLTLEKWHKLLCWIRDYGGNTPRIDANIDDYKREVSPFQMLLACKQEGFKSCKGVVGFNVYRFTESITTAGQGETITFGKRGNTGSGKQYTCYDKFVESKGEFHCYRHELSLSDEKAKEFFQNLTAGDVETMAATIASTIIGAVDFVDLSYFDPELTTIKGCPRLPWWDSFASSFGDPIKLASLPKKPVSFDSAVRYIRRQVAPTLAMIYNCYSLRKNNGDDFWKFFYTLWDIGEQNLNPRQKQIIAEQSAAWDSNKCKDMLRLLA